jgi:hypothetical protein
MAFTQTDPRVTQNEYGVAPQVGFSPTSFRADADRANPQDLGLSAPGWGQAAEPARRFHLPAKRSIVLILGLALVGGLVLLSALSLTAGGTSAQQTLMSPAAEKYWRNLDIAQVQKDMKGWSREDLAKLFVTIREQTSDLETRKHIDSLGRTLRLPGFESSSSLLSTLFNQPIFLLGIFLSIGIWGAAVVISIAPYVRWGRAPAFSPNAPLLTPTEQPTDAILEELLPEVTLEVAASETEEKKEEEKKNEEQPASEQNEEASSGLGDLASLFEEEDTSITALETFCKNLAEVVIDDLATRAKDLARDLRAFVAQSAPRPKPE